MNIKCLFSGHTYSFRMPKNVAPLPSGGYFHLGYECRCDRCGKSAPFEVCESDEIPTLQPIL